MYSVIAPFQIFYFTNEDDAINKACELSDRQPQGWTVQVILAGQVIFEIK